MPRMMIIDTYYPDVLDDLGTCSGETYAEALRRYLDLQFGTADFYSKHLRTIGWDVVDVIANSSYLGDLWAREHGTNSDNNVLTAMIELYKPEVLFLQNLTVLGSRLDYYRQKHFIAGQCSCAIRREVIPKFDIIFTSFRHYPERYGYLGCRFIYNPLAFEPSVLADAGAISPYEDASRPHDIVFVGGVGHPGHWAAGMEMLHAVADTFPDQFKWWGYGRDAIRSDSALANCYQGHAWGRDMFGIYNRSKIVLNRHGEVSQLYANNMRMYEATGCGACLLTEPKLNLIELFDVDECMTYQGSLDAVIKVKQLLTLPKQRQIIASNGQHRTLSEHTYFDRMQVVSNSILEMMK